MAKCIESIDKRLLDCCGNRGRLDAITFLVHERQQILEIKLPLLSSLSPQSRIFLVYHFFSPEKYSHETFENSQIHFVHLERFAVVFMATFPIQNLTSFRAIKRRKTSRTFQLRFTFAHFTTICHNFTRSHSRDNTN